MQNEFSNEVVFTPKVGSNRELTDIQIPATRSDSVKIEEKHTDQAQSNRQAIRLALPSLMHSVYILDAVISEIVMRMEFNEETREQVILAVTEAGTNAIKHGNKKEANKLAKFQFIVNPNKLTVIVQDQGAGFDRGTIPNPLHAENQFRGNGRGLFLIEECMDNVTYEASGTVIRMEKYRK